MDEPVDSGREGRYATDADFKVWSITGGLLVDGGKYGLKCEKYSDDEYKES